jgi:hypothetical protein
MERSRWLLVTPSMVFLACYVLATAIIAFVNVLILNKYEVKFGQSMSFRLDWIITTVMVSPLPIVTIVFVLILNPSKGSAFLIYALALLIASASAEYTYVWMY